MSVDSKSPGRNRGIVLRCSHPTYLSIVADPFPRPLPVGRISISSPSYEREWEKTWDSYSKHGRSCRLSPIDTNERDFLHTLVRKRPLGLSRFETMPHNVALQPRRSRSLELSQDYTRAAGCKRWVRQHSAEALSDVSPQRPNGARQVEGRDWQAPTGALL